MTPVVLCGGKGTRLWPVSRASLPKPFCDLFDEPLYLKTLKRLLPLGSPWTITTRALRTHAVAAGRAIGLPDAQTVCEPTGKDTAPAIALLCRLFGLRGKGNEGVGVFPADHMVQDEEGLRQAVELGARHAAEDKVLTLGMVPTRPATTFGYIQTGAPVPETPRVLTVRRFVEKPDEAQAQRLFDAGDCLWNAGIFLFRIDAMVKHFRTLMPDLWRRMEALDAEAANLEAVYEGIEPLSFDYGILERLDSLLCIPCDVGWSDMGSWEDASALPDDAKSNARVLTTAAGGNYVHGQAGKVYALAGVDDLIIVDTGDALLITRRGGQCALKISGRLARIRYF